MYSLVLNSLLLLYLFGNIYVKNAKLIMNYDQKEKVYAL